MGDFVNVGLLGCGLTGRQGGIDFLRLVANGITAVSTTRRMRVTLIIPEFASRSPEMRSSGLFAACRRGPR